MREKMDIVSDHGECNIFMEVQKNRNNKNNSLSTKTRLSFGEVCRMHRRRYIPP